jgi:hypothetical protein
MSRAMSSTCVASVSEHHFGHSRCRGSSLDSVDEREYKKAVQVLRNFHLRGSARPLDVIHEERDGFHHQQQQETTVSRSPGSIRRQVKAENLQALLADPANPPALDCRSAVESAAKTAASTPILDNKVSHQQTPFQRSEAKGPASYTKPPLAPLANRRSVRAKALLVWGRR